MASIYSPSFGVIGEIRHMASAFSHAFAAAGMATAFYQPKIPKRIWLAGLACAVFPDVAVIGFRFGIHYGDFWGHRGFTHSILFAGLIACCVVALWFRRSDNGLPPVTLFTFLSQLSVTECWTQ